MRNVLFVTHPEAQCGVYQYGFNTAMILKESTVFNFIHIPCSSFGELKEQVNNYLPCAIIYNYHVTVLGWANDYVISEFKGIKSLFLQHEYHQPVPESADIVISQDPTDKEEGKFVSVPRILHDYDGPVPNNDVLTIGTFGFGLADKGFDRLVSIVCKEFDKAIIRMHIPYASFGDGDGSQARGWAAEAYKQLIKPEVTLIIDHEWFSKQKLLEFLAGNDINVFMHGYHGNRGNSGLPDFALSVPRPLAITESFMFKHIWSKVPEILIENNSLKSIIDMGLTPLLSLKKEWSRDNLRKKYEKIVEDICQK